MYLMCHMLKMKKKPLIEHCKIYWWGGGLYFFIGNASYCEKNTRTTYSLPVNRSYLVGYVFFKSVQIS